jgi:hypothetical protein
VEQTTFLSFSGYRKHGLQRGGSKYYTGPDSDFFYQHTWGMRYTAYLAATGNRERYLMSYDYLRIAVGYNSGTRSCLTRKLRWAGVVLD